MNPTMWLGWGLVALAPLEPMKSIMPVVTPTVVVEERVVVTAVQNTPAITETVTPKNKDESKDLSNWFLLISLAVLAVIIAAQVITAKEEDQS